MKNNSIIGLVILSSIIASIFGAALTFKILNKGTNIKNNITGEEILSMQKEIDNIKSEKSTSNYQENTNKQVFNLEKSIIDITKNASDKVVSIIITKDLPIYKSDPWGFFKQKTGTIKEKVGGGTGFFVTKDGKIITNKHVVKDKNASYTIITNSGSELIAKVIAIDPILDLAIMQIESNSGVSIKTPTVNFINNENNIKIGQFAIAIGNKLGELENSVSFGLVSGKNRNIKNSSGNFSNLIQTDADIHQGNSGGPLLNLKGKVIGINTFIINSNKNIGFAIKLTKKDIDYILKSLEKYGKIVRPFLGIKYISNSKTIKENFNLRSDKGVYILNKTGAIKPGSSADKAGIQPGDIITQIDDTILNLENNLNSIIQSKTPGDKVKLKVIKPSGEIKRLQITL